MSTNESTQLTHELFQIMMQFSRLRLVEIAVMEMKQSEYQLLGVLSLTLNEEKPALSVTELSNLLQVTPASITHLVNPLEEGGYIERLEDPNDRRVVLIGLTDLGRDAAKQRMAEAHEKLKGLIEHLGAEDSKTFIRLMTLVVGYVSEQKETTK